MNLFSIPNDNIYKFYTFIGIAILFYTITFYDSWTTEFYEKQLYLLRDIKNLNIDKEHYEEKIKFLKLEIKELETESYSLKEDVKSFVQNDNKGSNDNREYYLSRVSSIEKKLNELSSTFLTLENYELKLKKADNEIYIKKELLTPLKTKVNLMKKLNVVFNIFGILLFIGGLIAWHFLIQMPPEKIDKPEIKVINFRSKIYKKYRR